MSSIAVRIRHAQHDTSKHLTTVAASEVAIEALVALIRRSGICTEVNGLDGSEGVTYQFRLDDQGAYLELIVGEA